ncbi:hypothetical protein ERO13_D01G171400v2 [Gossypium hirsutum]|uniref:Uncharacterized protein n=3 Tax=Gossypium TaxID=3633 RepID=A0A5J5SWP6_GOSBA|nr:hypothetical protein ES319_D01G207200v1 [Gossypium barbadense]KAB2046070.1 hypothetical protein ES319_D01G207200v1 [Gossypium barbadense]KAG4163445.1 hypothetical protein ERO13_D01G171400v2 [Gossypium hirsutum]TYG84093.1 hypothetical protein ES288_D01G222000v1 [Gossypium darwinii]TYI98415.1 hypothetical protein E1A91_D01G213000v1 [Gossypium mustelinum]
MDRKLGIGGHLMANSLHLQRLIILRYLFLELCTKPQIEKVYSFYLELKLEDVEPCISGPKSSFARNESRLACLLKQQSWIQGSDSQWH